MFGGRRNQGLGIGLLLVTLVAVSPQAIGLARVEFLGRSWSLPDERIGSGEIESPPQPFTTQAP